MKSLVFFLALLCVGLIGIMVVRSRHAGGQLRAAQTENLSLSNRLADAEMKLNHQERMNSALGGNLTNRTEELNKREADLARMRSNLAQAHNETAMARDESTATLAKVQEAKAEIEVLTKQIAELSAENQTRERLVEEARTQLETARVERAALSLQLADLQQTVNRLNYQLNNSDFLREQLEALPKANSSGTNQNARADLWQPLELLPDGSVRLVPLVTNSASKP
jgi:chromosome segregation ATPase